MVSTVFVAGYKNSTKGHWQREWFENTENSHWVEQDSWDAPSRDAWVSELDKLLSSIEGPILIITHSLGGSTLTEWAKQHSANIIGAFIVAPPDVHCDHFPDIISGFEQPLASKLAFPSQLIASTNDPYASFAEAKKLASSWGSTLINVGDLGHINVESNLSDWVQGKLLFAEFKTAIGLN